MSNKRPHDNESESEEEEQSIVKEKSVAPAPYPITTSDQYSRMTGSGTKEDPWTYTDEFGIVYEWDSKAQLWASKEDLDSLISKQQEVYAAQTAPKKELTEEEKELRKKRKKEKREKKKQQAAKEGKNISTVYVTGIPEDINDSDFVAFFSKCGIPKKDEETAVPKYKIYRDENGRPKGDAIFQYYKPESVDLAIKLLDDTEILPGHKIKVERAKFEPKNDGTSQPKKKKIKSKKVKTYNQERELGWDEDETRHVVLKYMFTFEEAKSDPNFFEDLEKEVGEECEKIGPVEKVKIFERHPKGIIVVMFEDSFDASACVEKMDGRTFAGRKIEASLYDGWTDYKSEEIRDDDEERKRIEEFGDWLENQ